MVPYPQLLDQQESDYLDYGWPLFPNFLFPFLFLTLLDKYCELKETVPSVKNWNNRFNITPTDRNLPTFPFTAAWTLPHESRMGGIEVGRGLGMAALTGDRGHACSEHRLWSPGGIAKNDSRLVLMAPRCHSSSGLTLMTSLLQAGTCHNGLFRKSITSSAAAAEFSPSSLWWPWTTLHISKHCVFMSVLSVTF